MILFLLSKTSILRSEVVNDCIVKTNLVVSFGKNLLNWLQLHDKWLFQPILTKLLILVYFSESCLLSCFDHAVPLYLMQPCCDFLQPYKLSNVTFKTLYSAANSHSRKDISLISGFILLILPDCTVYIQRYNLICLQWNKQSGDGF